MSAPSTYRSRRVIRNSVCYELTRVQGRVLYKIHCSEHHVWEIPADEWDAYPEP